MDELEIILRQHGPCLTTELADQLIDRCRITREAARKRVSRQGPGVKRLAYLPFPRNARFVYLQEQYGSPRFWDALIKALMENSAAYGSAIAALRQRGDLMPKHHFFIACGSPLAQQRHLSPQVVLNRLTQAKLFTEIEVPGIGLCVARAQSPQYLEDAIPKMQARLVCEEIVLKAVREWSRNLGLVSYEKTKIRESDDLPKVGTFAWDFSGPSYLGGLINRDSNGKPNPGFVACDIALDQEITESGLEPFIKKCRTLRSLKNIGRCLQIFVADKYHENAFRLAKNEGVIPATTASLFGKEVSESLKKLSNILTQAASTATNPKLFDELFNGLSRIEGAATNLRGALFEFWAAEAIRQTYPSCQIQMNRIFKDDNGRQAEVDVIAIAGNSQVMFCECKGYQPSGLVSDEEIDRWLEIRIPLVYKQAKNHSDWKNRTLKFEFWTTGRLSTAAIERIEKEKNTIRPGRYTLEYCDSARLVELAKSTGDRALLGTLQQHFIEHPIAKIERAQNRLTINSFEPENQRLAALRRDTKENQQQLKQDIENK